MQETWRCICWSPYGSCLKIRNRFVIFVDQRYFYTDLFKRSKIRYSLKQEDIFACFKNKHVDIENKFDLQIKFKSADTGLVLQRNLDLADVFFFEEMQKIRDDWPSSHTSTIGYLANRDI